MKIIVKENELKPETFIKLRKYYSNFIEYAKEDVEVALKNTLYSVCVYDGDKEIGIARVVGDGRICFFIKDVVVHPDYQGKNIGKLIMSYLFKYFAEVAADNAYIGLMATPNTEGFYEKFGFIRRPNERYGSGMILYYKREKQWKE